MSDVRSVARRQGGAKLAEAVESGDDVIKLLARAVVGG